MPAIYIRQTFSTHAQEIILTHLHIHEYQDNKSFAVKLSPLYENFFCSNFMSTINMRIIQ